MTETNAVTIPILPFEYTPSVMPTDELQREIVNHGLPLGIDKINWNDYPYAPNVTAHLAHDGKQLFCVFSVNERHLRVKALEDNGPVWEDSCVEIFIADADGSHYYNFETNAGGTALASRRVSRTDCEHFPPQQMQRIMRHSSLPRHEVSINSPNGIGWTLMVGIPFDLIGYNGIPAELRINLYKCGDKTDTPHFLSWAPISTPAPDFHRPEFFATVKLQQP